MKTYELFEKQILIALGLRLKFYRLSKNISQEELAELTGLHRTYVGSVERGERNISLINLHKIAYSLGVPVSKLIED